MPRSNINDLAAFVAIARARSFTRAASQIGVSPSALSHAMRGLEERLGLRLLHRTTRSVTLTEAGERLFGTIAPRLEEIDAEIDALSALRDKPGGTVRLTATEYAADMILLPRLAPMLREYPDVTVEVVIDYGLTDIVTERIDAGVRSGEQIAGDMVAVRIAPDMRMAVVASPEYIAEHGTPRVPQDLTGHRCINLRLPTLGGLYAWEFEQGRRELRVRVDGPLVFNSSGPIRTAALAGLGLAYLPEGQVEADLRNGTLVRVLGDWCEPFPGYHLYYPSRRQPTAAFRLVLEALRFRGS